MQLLPCPFCGAKNPLFNIATQPPGPITKRPGWYVRCRKCGARVDGGTFPSAMKRWNTRPAAPAPMTSDHPMKLSELLASIADPHSDPEILILRDWGELSPAKIQDPAELADGDPVIDLLAHAGDSIILVASNIDDPE